MKATLEFDLSLPEENKELRRSLKACNLAGFIDDFNTRLTEINKFEDVAAMSGEQMFKLVNSSFVDLLIYYDIDLDEDL